MRLEAPTVSGPDRQPPRQMRAIVVDDDREMRVSTSELLSAFGWDVRVLSAASRIDASLDDFPADVVLTDMRMPGMTGLDLLEHLAARPGAPPVVIMTAHADIDLAVDATRKGAYDFLEKPYDPERLIGVLERAANYNAAMQSTRRLRERVSTLSGFDRLFIGETPEAVALREQVMSLLDVTVPIMIRGETGTGKHLIAQALHDLGPASDAPLSRLDCTQITPERAIETLCGVEGEQVGVLQRIGEGTLLLSEVSACPLENQTKLLQVTDIGTFLPLGATTPCRFKGRIISTTNADLERCVAEGSFRKDLFYRLSGITIQVPPLRQRIEDIPLLFTAFLNQFATAYREQLPDLTTESTGALMAHSWPGNVRELRHVAERWILMRRTQPDATVSEAIGAGSGMRDLPRPLRLATAAFEAEIIAQAIVLKSGHMDEVADHLGIPRRTLNDRMAKLNLSKERILDQR